MLTPLALVLTELGTLDETFGNRQNVLQHCRRTSVSDEAFRRRATATLNATEQR